MRTGRDASAPKVLADAGDAAVPDAASVDASSSSSSSSGAEPPDAETSDAESSDADVEPGFCRVAYVYGIDQPVPGLADVTGATAFALTPDERQLAWVDGAGALRLASRASESVDFEEPVEIEVASSGFPGPHGLALSDDALHLILIDTAETHLAELTRIASTAPFDGNADPLPYAAVEPQSTGVRWPVLGNQGRLLAVSHTREDPRFSVLVADRVQPSDAWPLPSAQTEGVLETDVEAKHVTGVSYDGLTFFVKNDATGELFAVNRPNLGATFEPTYQRTLSPSARAAIPNAACDRLYLLRADGSLTLRRKLDE